MENLIGRKCKGFEFQNDVINYPACMSKYVGEIDVINDIQKENKVKIVFDDDYWFYPLSEIHKHLIPLEDEIPTLGEGKLMLVSNFQKEWSEREVFAKTKSGKYLAFTKELGIVKCYTNLRIWNFAKEKLEQSSETEEIVELTIKDVSEGKGVGVKPSLIRIKE